LSRSIDVTTTIVLIVSPSLNGESRPLCACFAIRPDGCMLGPHVTPVGDQK